MGFDFQLTSVEGNTMLVYSGWSNGSAGTRLQASRKGSTMDKNLIARASIDIHAPREKVWKALVDPAAIRQYMFGTHVISDWQEGSPIVWKGEWEGKPYEDKGVILLFKPGEKLQYSHFSPLSELPDVPEDYHTVTIELTSEGDQIRVTLEQDNNESEEARSHSEKNWKMMLDSMKKFLEG
jgi:uncharacterized protein YndB with AHSA1/START domain